MLIICSREPSEAVQYLIDNTDKKFCITQLRELCQLISSAGISQAYKKRPQAKEIQKWIQKYPIWILTFLRCLYRYCREECNLSPDFIQKIEQVQRDLKSYCSGKEVKSPNRIVWRYYKEYQSDYVTNSLTLIDIGIEEYKKYLVWKGYKSE